MDVPDVAVCLGPATGSGVPGYRSHGGNPPRAAAAPPRRRPRHQKEEKDTKKRTLFRVVPKI